MPPIDASALYEPTEQTKTMNKVRPLYVPMHPSTRNAFPFPVPLRLLRWLMLVVLSSALLRVVSQPVSQPVTPVGSWQIDVDRTLSLVSGADAARLDSLGAAALEVIRADFSTQTYVFEADQTFTVTSAQGTFTGRWSQTGSALQLTMDASGAEVTHQIVSLSASEWVLEVVPATRREAYLHHICLIKQP